MKKAVIVSINRTAVGKAHIGTLAKLRSEDIAKPVFNTILKRLPMISKEKVDDIIIGCARQEGEQGLNIARIIALYSGYPESVPAITINRLCASGLQSLAYARDRVISSEADIIIAGGIESMSRVARTSSEFSPHIKIIKDIPSIYMSMGLTAELVAKKYRISRKEQDHFALTSHKRAMKAIKDNKFKEEIVPIVIRNFDLKESFNFDIDECIRKDTNLDVLSKIKPAFIEDGSVTAGNSCQLSDGAAASLIMSDKMARTMDIKPLAMIISYAVVGVSPDIMGIGPSLAIPKALKLAGMSIKDVDLFEINEAFASQCIQVIESLNLDYCKVNVNGGAIALGHPLGCTGTKLTASLIYELQRRGGGIGVVSMCVGGGMGVAMVLEVYKN